MAFFLMDRRMSRFKSKAGMKIEQLSGGLRCNFPIIVQLRGGRRVEPWFSGEKRDVYWLAASLSEAASARSVAIRSAQS
jgi:hypothetical protein